MKSRDRYRQSIIHRRYHTVDCPSVRPTSSLITHSQSPIIQCSNSFQMLRLLLMKRNRGLKSPCRPLVFAPTTPSNGVENSVVPAAPNDLKDLTGVVLHTKGGGMRVPVRVSCRIWNSNSPILKRTFPADKTISHE